MLERCVAHAPAQHKRVVDQAARYAVPRQVDKSGTVSLGRKAASADQGFGGRAARSPLGAGAAGHRVVAERLGFDGDEALAPLFIIRSYLSLLVIAASPSRTKNFSTPGLMCISLVSALPPEMLGLQLRQPAGGDRQFG